jgi:aspartyl protease family protein
MRNSAMSEGPWGDPKPAPNPAPLSRDNIRTRWLIWIALILAGALGVWELARLFPDSVSAQYDAPYLVRTLALLVIVSAGLVFARQIKVRETIRNLSIWMGIAAVLVLGYTYQDELAEIGGRVTSELVPGEPVMVGAHTMALTESDGGFAVFGEANGVRLKFLVDTGASDIVLSPADARRVGLDPAALQFSRQYETANGPGLGAPATLSSLSVGPIRLANVPVSVNRAGMHSSLLGMAFLKRMKSFEIRGRKLYLRWQ